MNKKINGFNNGIDVSDGVGGEPPYPIHVQINDKRLNASDIKGSFSFTYNDLKLAFETGKLYGDGELPLVNDYDFSNNPQLTAFDVWFDDWFKKRYT